MDKLEEKRKRRFIYLNALYEKTDGDTLKHISMFDLGRGIGFSDEETQKVVNYLIGENLLEIVDFQGIAISHYGVVNVEEALSSPEEETHYFPPVVNVMNVHTMIGSQIQQGTIGSSQVITLSSEDLLSLQQLVKELLEKLPELDLSDSARREMEAEAKTINSQVSSPNPKQSIIKESISSIKTILEGAAGNIIASEFLRNWLPIISKMLGSA